MRAGRQHVVVWHGRVFPGSVREESNGQGLLTTQLTNEPQHLNEAQRQHQLNGNISQLCTTSGATHVQGGAQLTFAVQLAYNLEALAIVMPLQLPLPLCVSQGLSWAEDAGRDMPAVRLALDPVLCIWRATSAAYTPFASMRSPCCPCSTSLPLLITHILSACTYAEVSMAQDIVRPRPAAITTCPTCSP